MWDCPKKAGTTSASTSTSAGTRTFANTAPTLRNEGRSARWAVRSMSLYSKRVSAGKNTMTVTKLNTMPLTRLTPKSAPIWNCMNDSAANPKSVVTALAAMVESDRRMARAMARSGVGCTARSSAKACSRKMGVVKRHRQLQDGAHGKRDERHLAEHDVRAHVDKDGHPDGADEQHRLDPRPRGQDEQKQDDGHQDERGLAGLFARAGRGLRRVRRVARHRVVRPRLVHERAQGAHRLPFSPFGHGDLEKRRAVAIVRLHRGLVDHLERHGHVRHVVEPHDALHAVDGGHPVLEGERLSHRHVAHEHVGIGNGLGELFAP